ncbi:MAG: preprotein translocase subunit SecA, partial [Planctomycetota bacterium]
MSIQQLLLRSKVYRQGHVSRSIRSIHRFSKEFATLSDAQLRKQSLELQYRAKSAEPISKLMCPGFALIREASDRVLGMQHFDVQLMAGILLCNKCIVEMATGEGKTLTAVLPLFLNALKGRGTHLATANDYLARRDGMRMRPVFELLGMSLGVIQDQSSDEERREAYAAHVTYGTLAQFGFDFLRDRMKARAKTQLESRAKRESPRLASVCRPYHFILVDEADSIMIDDASTPLIIGAPNEMRSQSKKSLYRWAAEVAPEAREHTEYRHIEHEKKSELTERGRSWVRQLAQDSAVATAPIADLYEYVERAIKVERDYFLGKNYLVQEGKVTIIDENTGRIAVGRFWQDGLHQAIQ